MSATIIPYRGTVPRIHPDAFVAPNATVIGDVEIGRGASLWFGVIARGDVHRIRIGEDSNLQDGTIIHVSRGTHATLIGARVTVGHGCIIHGCTLEDEAFVAMGATVLDGAVVESGAVVAAGALVPPNKRVKKGELWAGNPAKLLRNLTEADQARFGRTWTSYAELGREYRLAASSREAAAD